MVRRFSPSLIVIWLLSPLATGFPLRLIVAIAATEAPIRISVKVMGATVPFEIEVDF